MHQLQITDQINGHTVVKKSKRPGRLEIFFAKPDENEAELRYQYNLAKNNYLTNRKKLIHKSRAVNFLFWSSVTISLIGKN